MYRMGTKLIITIQDFTAQAVEGLYCNLDLNENFKMSVLLFFVIIFFLPVLFRHNEEQNCVSMQIPFL